MNPIIRPGHHPAPLQCSKVACTENGKEETLECQVCHRHVHFKCTMLPKYQLTLFVTTRQRYTCESCVTIPEYIINANTYVNDENFGGDTQELKKKIECLEEELKDQEEKFDQAGNPEYDYLIRLERYIKSKLEDFGESLLKEVISNGQTMEIKVTEALKGTKTYSESVTNNTHVSNPPQDFRSIVREAREEEKAEEIEQLKRKCNVILHGIPEDREKEQENDQTYVAGLLNTLALPITYKSISRIGQKDNEKRPLKLVMSSESEKDRFMSRLSNLKNNSNFFGLSITDDYTQYQRKIIKDWVAKANKKNQEECDNSLYIWRARGTPKNGMFLKKLLKKKPQQQSQDP